MIVVWSATGNGGDENERFLTNARQLFHAHDQTSITISTIMRSKQINRIRMVQKCCDPLSKWPLNALLICEPIFPLMAKNFQLNVNIVSLLISKNIRFKALHVFCVAMLNPIRYMYVIICTCYDLNSNNERGEFHAV